MQRRTSKTVAFTKQKLDLLDRSNSEAKREYWYDEKTPGLAICVTSAGTKTFYLVRRVASKVEFLRLGGYPETTIEQARNEAAKLNGKIAEGGDPAAQRRKTRQTLTLGAAFEAFKLLPTRTKTKRPRSAKTQKEYEQAFNRYFDGWRHKLLSQISRQDVEYWHNGIGANSGHYAANRALELLKAIYNSAIDAGYEGANPAARMAKFEERSRDRFLQADELPKFWKALEALDSTKVKDAIKLLLLTGQRKSNVLQMRFEDLHLEREVWTIPMTKNGRPHTVPLTSSALEILKRRSEGQGGSGYVFPGKHGKPFVTDIMRQWRDVLSAAGLEDLRPHDLRRSLGSWQTITGANAKTVGRTLGQLDPAATAVYAHVDLATVRDAMDTATTKMLAHANPTAEKTRRRKPKQ